MVNMDEVLHETAAEESKRRFGDNGFALVGGYLTGGASYSVGYMDAGGVQMRGLGRTWREAFSNSEPTAQSS